MCYVCRVHTVQSTHNKKVFYIIVYNIVHESTLCRFSLWVCQLSETLGLVAYLLWEAQVYVGPLGIYHSGLLEVPHEKGNSSTRWLFGDLFQ